jgi:hypothetical protein
MPDPVSGTGQARSGIQGLLDAGFRRNDDLTDVWEIFSCFVVTPGAGVFGSINIYFFYTLPINNQVLSIKRRKENGTFCGYEHAEEVLCG